MEFYWLSSASTVEQTPVKYMKDSFFRTPETKCDPNPQETFKKKNVIEALNPEIMSKEEYKKKFCPEPIPDYFSCQEIV